MSSLARLPVLVVSGLTAMVLMAMSGRYGYHRDELYFVAAGRHLAWGYPDQPPLIPLVARAATAVAPGSLVVLRLPAALMATVVVALTGVLAHRLGASRSGQLLAAAAVALTGFLPAMGHLLSTATADLLGWVLLSVLLVCLLQGGDRRLWLVVGAVAGVTAQANVLVGFLLLAVLVALLLDPGRRLLASPWPIAGGLLALAGALPYMLWQAGHGWPQLQVARHIAAGASGTSTSRLTFVPLLVLLIGPCLAPIWLLGLRRLWQDPRLRPLAVAFLLLVGVFVALGGKPYYLAGLVPLLLAAGAQPLLDWAPRLVPPALLVLSAPALLVVLPLLPERAAAAVVTVNYDAGETIGWPQFTDQVAADYRRLPAGSVLITGNYGEAGALDRFGPDRGLPAAFSGHNGFGLWGAPPGQTLALVVGIRAQDLAGDCEQVRDLGSVRSPHGLRNDENGAPLFECRPDRPWALLWARFRHLG